MGLLKAGLGALGGVLADQWKEFFCCDALDMDTLMVKGEKRISGRSSNTKGSDNVISNDFFLYRTIDRRKKESSSSNSSGSSRSVSGGSI